MKQNTKFDNGTWKTELRKISDLKPNPKNPRTITKDTIKPLRQSMRDNGYTDRIMIDNHNMILSGHARWLVFKEEDPNAEIECLVAQRELTEEEKQRAIIGLNRDGGIDDITALQMDFDPVILAQYDITVDKSDEYNTKEIEEVEIPEDVETRVQPGEIWALGDHRLMCGDSTNLADINKLMNGEKANMLLTDPPYNVEIVGGNHSESPEKRKKKGNLIIANDNMSDEQFKEFLTKAFVIANTNMKNGAVFYIWYADIESYNFYQAAKNADLQIRQNLIWIKNSLVMGRKDYQFRHEPCLYGWTDGASHTWNGGRKQTTTMEAIDLMNEEDLRKAYKELVEQLDTSVIYENKPAKNKEHPTMKPIKLMARLIRNSSNVGDIILDLFGGSGSTLIACEQIGRKCYMNELDPHYASVIIQRWVKFTGKEDEVFRINPDGTKTKYKDVLCEKV